MVPCAVSSQVHVPLRRILIIIDRPKQRLLFASDASLHHSKQALITHNTLDKPHTPLPQHAFRLKTIIMPSPIVAAFGVLLLATTACAFAAPRTLYDFTLKDATGTMQSLAAYKDKPVTLM